MNIDFFTFPNLGVLRSDLSDDELAPIRDEVAQIEQDFSLARPHNDKLVGNIKREFRLFDSQVHLNNIITKRVTEYDKKYDFVASNWILSKDLPLMVIDPWVNFMRKHEFNPPHNHTGLLSFVIWLKIPYTIENERKFSPGANSLQPMAGTFSFHYTNIIGNLNSWIIPADNTYENTMLLFPSQLSHSVSPFYTSDEYRISIAGNLRFQV